MEPLLIIALTGNIIQFVERVSYLVSAGREISASDATCEYDELSLIAKELKNLVSDIILPDGEEYDRLDKEEKSLRALGAQCNEVAQELLQVLESLKVKSKDKRSRQVETFYKLLLSEWKKPKVENLQGRLARIGSSIQTHISAYDSRKILGRLDRLSSQNKLLEAHRNGEIDRLRAQTESLFKNIGRKLQNQESRNYIMTALLNAAASGSQYAIEQFILEQMRYEEMSYRYEAIRDAHDNTFSWLFSSSEQQSPANFEEWLESDDDVYWISGKPGSGKSTLMKFLYNNPGTVEKLRLHANGKRIVLASFFFWDMGKSIQKSQEGLLRALIFEILRQTPELIARVFPTMWHLFASKYGGISRQAHAQSVSESLSVRGLLDTLSRISALAVGSDLKFCFLIDGLDEYHGQPRDVIELIKLLRKVPNVKICVSSRPWNEFEREFGTVDSRTLSMQEYNSSDIEKYVHDKLEQDENYQDLEDVNSNGKLLVEEIVQAANGVFLWVFLVVRSFQQGLENGDSIWDLRERLKQLPKDLNRYFDRIILSDVEDFYHGHSAEMFMVTLEGVERLPLLAYWYLREDTKYILEMEQRPLSIQRFNKRLKDTKKRLNAACKGLLEVRYITPQEDVTGRDSFLPSSTFYDRRVGFLHRTVGEYLKLDTTKAILQKRLSADFLPHETASKVLLAYLKILPQDLVHNGFIHHYETNFKLHMNIAASETDRGTDRFQRLKELYNDFRKMRPMDTAFAALDESTDDENTSTETCMDSKSSSHTAVGKRQISNIVEGMRKKMRKAEP
ncbi:hypothetical protein IQ07DRAFT_290683 [Pyrenochaeta sp. DS3sAY3a]|nr:hypothetical protein IQ07DRAFT_290683 [Pyrenochaeta sp. DS3sAY3a]